MTERAFNVGDRVTHIDGLRPPGSDAVLQMAGSVVGVQVRYLVEWDGEQPRPVTGWTPTHYYDAEQLRRLEGKAAA